MTDQNQPNNQTPNLTSPEVTPIKNYRPYIYTAIVAFIAVGGLGYYLMPEKVMYEPISGLEDNHQDSNFSVSTSTTYTNSEYGYSLQYGSGIEVSEIDTPPIKSACVLIKVEGGSIYINSGSNVLCGVSGIDSPRVAVDDSVATNDRQYSVSGFFFPNTISSFFTFNLNKNTVVTFGVDGAPSKWVYDQILFSLKDVMSTIQLKSENTSTLNPSVPVACTMDAMMCPDGSYVGRSGPDCEFVCPSDGAIIMRAEEILSVLQARNYSKLEESVSSDGLSLNNFAFLDFSRNLILKKDISDISTNVEKRRWGSMDGSGFPIDLTAKDFIEKWIVRASPSYGEAKVVRTIENRGNNGVSILEDVGNRVVVSFYDPGDPNSFSYQTLYMVFDQEHGVYFLRGMVTDQWGI